jgi:integrase
LYRSPVDRVWRRLTLASYPALSVKAARKQASMAAARVAEKADPAVEKKTQRQTADLVLRNSVGTVVIEFKTGMAVNYRPTWRYEVDRILSKEILPRWGRRLITDITEQDVADLQAEIRERGSASMADSVVGVVKSLFRFARKAPRRYVSTNPAAEIELAPYKPRQHALSDPEIRLLWNACESFGNYGRILKLLLLTGARRNEIGHLRWSEVNLPERLLILPSSRTKTETAQLVPLSEPAMAILKPLFRDGFRDGDLVFRSLTGRQINAWGSLKPRLDKALGEAMRPWRVHDLRRTCRTGLSRLRIAPHVAEAVIGHSAPAIVRTYDVHDLADEKRHALEAWGSFVLRIVSPEANVIPLYGQ